MTQDAQGSSLIAFLGFWPVDESGGYTGAIMVTDERGYPLELRVASPVRPSAVQRALFGESLTRYLIVELIGKRLCAELQRRPVVALSNERVASDIEGAFPVVFAAPADEIVLHEDARLSYQRVDDGTRSIGLLGHHNDVEASAQILKNTTKHFDPLAAFDRIRTALGVLSESDPRYR